jgi:hypothetical protein
MPASGAAGVVAEVTVPLMIPPSCMTWLMLLTRRLPRILIKGAVA